MTKNHIYIVCPVRGVTGEQKQEMDDYVKRLRGEGHHVHYPPDSVDQNDPTGYNICSQHFESMVLADEVHLFWDVSSSGSHFDLGMFFALWQTSIAEKKPGIIPGPKLVLAKLFQEDGPNKSYAKVIREIIARQENQP